MRHPVMDEQADLGVGGEIVGFVTRWRRRHYDHRGGCVRAGGGGQVGVVHERDVGGVGGRSGKVQL